jgi:hypothetical protein
MLKVGSVPGLLVTLAARPLIVNLPLSELNARRLMPGVRRQTRELGRSPKEL